MKFFFRVGDVSVQPRLRVTRGRLTRFLAISSSGAISGVASKVAEMRRLIFWEPPEESVHLRKRSMGLGVADVLHETHYLRERWGVPPRGKDQRKSRLPPATHALAAGSISQSSFQR